MSTPKSHLKGVAKVAPEIQKRAQRASAYAIKCGILVRPTNCSKCGKECVPHGHHFNYKLPLSVIWLCARCHKRIPGHAFSERKANGLPPVKPIKRLIDIEAYKRNPMFKDRIKTCLQCHYEWLTVIKTKSVACPACKSRDWNKPKPK